MEHPFQARLIHLSRMFNRPLFEIESWPLDEIISQNALALMQTDDFKKRYEMERQASLSLEQRFNEIEVD